jgi:hypothetical protein
MMPRKVCLENLRKIDSEQAKEMQKLSAEARKRNTKERKLIRQVIEERLGNKDLVEIVDNLIKRAKLDSKDFETLQAALGQKPKEELNLNGGVVIVDDIK